MPHAVIVEDDPDSLEALTRLIGRDGFTVASAGSLEEARTVIQRESPAVILLDLYLPDGNGLELLREIRATTSCEIVVMTGQASLESAIEALRLGAFEYLTKPIDLPSLERVMSKLHRTLLREEIGVLRGELKSQGRFGRLVGSSPAMRTIYELLARIGPTDAAVLLTGESGTGKEVAAMTLHDLSQRRDQPFVAVNCGAIAANMIESELFGHERGSFTGAAQKHNGFFERASGGTLLLDEITEMQPDLQVKLLRVLETGRLFRVGGEKEVEVDVRVIAATNQDPRKAIADKKLREDLFYRLKVFEMNLPPLRARGDDVELLALHFLHALNESSGSAKKKFTKEALARLQAHAWPGNVRELKNIVQAAFILAHDTIGIECIGLSRDDQPGAAALPRELTDTTFATPTSANGDAPKERDILIPIGTSVAEAERRLILATFAHCGGNKNIAAQRLGISLKTMYNRLKEYEETGI